MIAAACVAAPAAVPASGLFCWFHNVVLLSKLRQIPVEHRKG
jgi:hypothetical protein